MDRAMRRYDWEEQEEAQRLTVEEEEKDEKEQMHLIDWHDFVIVETIEFTGEDENIPLAAPIDVKTGAPQGPPVALDGKGAISAAAKIEKPKDMDDDDDDKPAAV